MKQPRWVSQPLGHASSFSRYAYVKSKTCLCKINWLEKLFRRPHFFLRVTSPCPVPPITSFPKSLIHVSHLSPKELNRHWHKDPMGKHQYQSLCGWVFLFVHFVFFTSLFLKCKGRKWKDGGLKASGGGNPWKRRKNDRRNKEM